MRRACDFCGKTYEAKTGRSLYCHRVKCDKDRERDKKQKQRGPGAAVVDLPQREQPEMRGTLEVTIAELTAADRLNSVHGQTAVAIARRIDFGSARDTGSSFAALVRELRSSLDAALAGAKTEGPVDELRRLREKRLAGG